VTSALPGGDWAAVVIVALLAVAAVLIALLDRRTRRIRVGVFFEREREEDPPRDDG
jgi:hypothetical protein